MNIKTCYSPFFQQEEKFPCRKNEELGKGWNDLFEKKSRIFEPKGKQSFQLNTIYKTALFVGKAYCSAEVYRSQFKVKVCLIECYVTSTNFQR